MTEGKARFKRLVIYWTGWAFIALGILGIFLPVLQGVFFLLIGLLLLSNSSPRAARLLNHIRGRFPKLSEKLDEATVKAVEVQASIAAHFESRESKLPHKHPGQL